MHFSRPVKAVFWFGSSIVCGGLAMRFYGSAAMPKSSAGLIGWCFVSIAMFFRMLFIPEVEKPEIVPPETGIPINQIFELFGRSGLHFSYVADQVVIDDLVEFHLEEPVTTELILASLGDLVSRGRLRPKNVAAANCEDQAGLKKALKKLSDDPSKKLYSVQVYQMIIFVRMTEENAKTLNDGFEADGIEFLPDPGLI